MQRAMAFDGERSTERANLRNGYRERLWETRAGPKPFVIHTCPSCRLGVASSTAGDKERHHADGDICIVSNSPTRKQSHPETDHELADQR